MNKTQCFKGTDSIVYTSNNNSFRNHLNNWPDNPQLSAVDHNDMPLTVPLSLKKSINKPRTTFNLSSENAIQTLALKNNLTPNRDTENDHCNLVMPDINITS